MNVRLLLLIPLLAGCGLNLSLLATPGSTSPLRTLAKERDPVAIIRQANIEVANRNPELLALKYKKMKQSAFSFFRGSAPLYYRDVQSRLGGPRIQIQGDLHLENLGTYQTSKGLIAYDLNDFDEACTAPVSWEIARCTTSIRLALHEAGVQDVSSRANAFLSTYFQQLQRVDAAELSRPFVPTSGPAAEAIRMAKQGNYLDGMISNGKFILGKKLSAVSAREKAEIEQTIQRYAAGRKAANFFRIKDLASRIAGTASIGRYRFEVLVEGATSSPADDRVLEVKEETRPAAMSQCGNQAERVCKAYAYFLPDPDPLLGTAHLLGEDFLVRELQPAKGGVELKDLEDWPHFLTTVAEVVARAHARSGKAGDILKEVKSEEINRFAKEYADLVEQDYQAFKKAF